MREAGPLLLMTHFSPARRDALRRRAMTMIFMRLMRWRYSIDAAAYLLARVVPVGHANERWPIFPATRRY